MFYGKVILVWQGNIQSSFYKVHLLFKKDIEISHLVRLSTVKSRNLKWQPTEIYSVDYPQTFFPQKLNIFFVTGEQVTDDEKIKTFIFLGKHLLVLVLWLSKLWWFVSDLMDRRVPKSRKQHCNFVEVMSL